MTGHYCPVEGCDYGEQGDKTLAAVRSHINACNDDAHDWDQLKAAVEAQTEQADEPETESDDEQPEAVESNGNDMVSQQEYERQQSEQSNSSESDGDDGDSAGGSDGGTEETTSVDEFLPDFSLSTYVLLVSALLAALIIWRVWKSRQQSEPVDLDDEEDETSDAVDRNEVTMLE